MLNDNTNQNCSPNDAKEKSAARLRRVGNKNLPFEIPLLIGEKPFLIGRYDINIGRRQCDFEFEPNTVAVSRRHAAIKRIPYGFVIVDLDSRAGTFINGNRISAGEQYQIIHGDRIAFGTAGANYVFESDMSKG